MVRLIVRRRRPRTEPEVRRDEVRADRIERHAAIIRDAAAGVRSLLAESGRPLVRAQMRHTRKARQKIMLAAVAVPLLILGFFLAAAYSERVEDYAALSWPPFAGPFSLAGLVGMFLCLWPLALFLVAGLRAASSVLAEREQHTAIQLVLTPIAMREVAAAKILPHLRPFLWGVFAALPLYLAAGSSEALYMERHDSPFSPLALWPLRVLAAANLEGWRLDFTPAGLGVGLVMCLGDLAMVWAAAHWGAAFAVRHRSIAGTALSLAWRLLVAAAACLGYWLLALIPWAIFASLVTDSCRDTLGFIPVLKGMLEFIAVLGQLAVLGLLWWLWPVRGSVRAALREFSGFDGLVDEEYRPPRRLSLTAWRWWEVNWRR